MNDKDVSRSTPGAEAVALMYRRMAITRAIEICMAKHVRNNRFSGWWHPGEGQEAAGIGATAAMQQDDYLFYQGRGCSWAIGKGMAPAPILGDLLGKPSGATGGKGGGVPHWSDYSIGVMGEGATLGSVYPLAAGAALAARLRGTGQVALANFGDGTAARGTFHETMVHAAAWKLPLIYFCENNEWLVGTPLKQVSPTENIADYAAGYHIPGVIVDGQDALAVYQVTTEAIARARAGEGPTLIEAKVFRKHGHYAGDPQHYRASNYLDTYRDPLDLLGTHLGDDQAADLREQATADVQSAYEAALAEADPEPDTIFKDLYYG
ncbi:thiamine pyrophosphate-dependent dehydrogenase E1 component subunit alpha [Parahaliea aestuarii]|uniref:Thiamine pyrophosphate-dependent dehydrogenase E1 component subunit alpha n=1 Tax=Parahaliea aestuarii TaxID=1852021 RepID=A0A5C8ZTG2_9GAMM|nr:thiamine pyrophosphate-dependent dehydrogenase E1 component subunit alpha [Parahaliea aestuarii]TXS91793.1 thiamine pyrophosphate-dependent dehydrogenase E1 component subunit alpha [Parahaliea aestuarii]